jgi:hypothetical protein
MVKLSIVGFLPRNIVASGKDKFIGEFAQIIELYEFSDNETKQRKSHKNSGGELLLFICYTTFKNKNKKY